MATITLNIPEGHEETAVIVDNATEALEKLKAWLGKIPEEVKIATYPWLQDKIDRIEDSMNTSIFEEYMEDSLDKGTIFIARIECVVGEDGAYYDIMLTYVQDGSVNVWEEQSGKFNRQFFKRLTGSSRDFTLKTWKEGHQMIQKVIDAKNQLTPPEESE